MLTSGLSGARRASQRDLMRDGSNAAFRPPAVLSVSVRCHTKTQVKSDDSFLSAFF